MPLPGTGLFDPGWSEFHRPTATTAMTAECVITRRGAGGTTAADGTFTPAAATTVYAGPARLVALWTNERLLARGETQETHRRYQVSIRHDAAEVKLGDIVAVTAAVDAGLVVRRLRVIDIRYGSEQWQRDFICDELEA